MLPKVKTFRAFIILMTLTLITGCRKYSLTDGTPLTTPRSVISQSLSPIADAYVQDGAYAFSNYGTAQWLIAKRTALDTKENRI
ncbi:hypothetical protein [Niabella hibiscisoli]|uniref:hypothetical protein n=1 Tax=Niabella hibiscisoli TaxID=1825928 RepID=UPI001F0D4A6B|nr:hypothetical protein [Niabella hibiscisoli]MCH5718146.1 hypothetical protein [Niabella hibiscisoli]